MSESPHIFDVTIDEFQSRVVDASQRVPVVVDFWAAWCGPCKMLMPVLTRLAEESGGEFILAKVNIDEQQELAMQFQVRSVPTVKILRFGQVADEFMGAQPESQIRAIIDRHVERESDRRLQEAVGKYAGGEADAAVAIAREVLTREPGHARARLALAEMLIGNGEFGEARGLLDELPVDQRMEKTVQQLLARLDLTEAAAGAPSAENLEQALAADPDDHRAREQLAARRLAAGDYEGALQAFLELMRRDRAYGDDAGRKGMLKVFELLGDDPLVGTYRRQMARLLY